MATITSGSTGTDSADKIVLGAGNDIIDGGLGSDTINAGAGDDTLIYTYANENGVTDYYNGGSGTDTLVLDFTKYVWTRDAWIAFEQTLDKRVAEFQKMVQDYKAANGTLPNSSAAKFEFDFGNGTKLQVAMTEIVEVKKPVLNQAPVIDSTSGLAGRLKEGLSDGQSQLTEGIVGYVDPDQGDTVTLHVDKAAATIAYTSYGQTQRQPLPDGIDVAALRDALLIDSKTGAWIYDARAIDLNCLRLADAITITYTVTATDSSGATDSKPLTIRIVGTNDAALISQPSAPLLTEDSHVADGQLTAQGALGVVDPDLGESSFRPTFLSGPDHLGTLQLSADGSYHYTVANDAVQFLGAGQQAVDTFTVQSLDGTEGTVSFEIAGVNDAAVIEAAGATEATEDLDVYNGQLAIKGRLSVYDVDAGESALQEGFISPMEPYGQLFLDAKEGTYGYLVANDRVQSLGAGQSLEDRFLVRALDGTAKELTFTIHGVNDEAQIGDLEIKPSVEADQGLSGPAIAWDLDGKYSWKGSISIADVDAGEAAFKPVVLGAEGNLGVLTLNPDGSCTYEVDKAVFQALSPHQSQTETFVVESVDGTTRTVSFTYRGPNHTPIATQFTAEEWTSGDSLPGDGDILGRMSTTDVDPKDSFTYAFIDPATGQQVEALTVGDVAFWFSGDALVSGGLSEGHSYNLEIVAVDPAGAQSPVETVKIVTGTSNSDSVLLSDQNADLLVYGLDGSNNVARFGEFRLAYGDSVHAGAGNDTVFGQDGPNFVYGGDGNDWLYGGADNDRLWGELGDDTLIGGNGDDVLFDSQGSDVLNGGDGDDVFCLEGGGTATMTGGAGSDRFLFAQVQANAGGADHILDFTPFEDVIDIHWLIELAADGSGSGVTDYGTVTLDAHSESDVKQVEWTRFDPADVASQTVGEATRIVINSQTGGLYELYFDPTGGTMGDAVLFAYVQEAPPLAA